MITNIESIISERQIFEKEKQLLGYVSVSEQLLQGRNLL